MPKNQKMVRKNSGKRRENEKTTKWGATIDNITTDYGQISTEKQSKEKQTEKLPTLWTDSN